MSRGMGGHAGRTRGNRCVIHRHAGSRAVRRRAVELFAIDNDGGSDRGPEHEPSHNPQIEAANEDGCRVCFLDEVIPSWWAVRACKNTAGQTG